MDVVHAIERVKVKDSKPLTPIKIISTGFVNQFGPPLRRSAWFKLRMQGKQGVESIRSGHCMIRDPPWRHFAYKDWVCSNQCMQSCGVIEDAACLIATSTAASESA
jgi:hypothetical protein